MENEELVARIQAGENVTKNMELLYSQIRCRRATLLCIRQ